MHAGPSCVCMATRRRPSKGGEQARDDAGLPQDRLQEPWYRKLLVAEAEYDKETFEELYDVIYWFRQGLSFILGLVWGLLPVKGLPGISSFLFLSVGLPFLYYTKYLKVDEDSYGRLALVQEGLQSAAGVFFTTWIITYTYAHGNKVAA